MAYDINTALERLEKNLSDVESAKLQVDETIATSESLQQIISRYSESLQSLNSEISTLVAEVNNYQSLKTSQLDGAIAKIMDTCDRVVNKFNADIKKSTNNFGELCAEASKSIEVESSKLAEHVNKIDSLYTVLDKATKEVVDIKKTLDMISEDIKISQGEQDKSLANIQSSLLSLSTSITSQINSVQTLFNSNYSDLMNKSDKINSEVSFVNNKIEKVLSVLTETNTICIGIKADIVSLKRDVESYDSSIQSVLKTNRWIVIGGVAVLIILHFI